MTERPTAARGHWPYLDHRTLAQVAADELVSAPITCRTCGDDVHPEEQGFSCAYRACPINREPLW